MSRLRSGEIKINEGNGMEVKNDETRNGGTVVKYELVVVIKKANAYDVTSATITAKTQGNRRQQGKRANAKPTTIVAMEQWQWVIPENINT